MNFQSLSDDKLAQIYQQNQLLMYHPVSPEANKLHKSTAKQLIACGGNRSTKTDTALVELAIQMTGIVPESLVGIYPPAKIRPPIRARIVCNSLTIALETVIKPKLQYWRWNGRGDWKGGLGHWGWIPPKMLIHGKWEDSYSEKHRLLTLTNGSTCQMFSYDQDLSDFSADSVHFILEDEAPPKDIHRENLVRTMDTKGQVCVTVTPPDDSNLAWNQAWIYDDLYERGLPGETKDPNIDTFTFLTLDNKILDPAEIAVTVANMTPEQRAAKLEGKFIHLSGRIYKEFASRPQYWCFSCKQVTHCIDGACIACKAINGISYINVIEPFSLKPYNWPIIFAFDPHPRKPHAMAWYAIDPNDDLIQIAELELDADPDEVKKQVDKLGETGGFNVRKNLIDPNAGESPSGVRRGLTVRQTYSDVGLRFDLANDNRDTARTTIRQMLVPDPRLQKPRLRIFSSCQKTIYQMNHYSWDEWTRYSTDNRNPKAKPREKDDDFPTLLGYVANLQPKFRAYIHDNPMGFHIVGDWNPTLDSRQKSKRWMPTRDVTWPIVR